MCYLCFLEKNNSTKRVLHVSLVQNKKQISKTVTEQALMFLQLHPD